MNKKELELRIETLKEQQRLTSKAIEDTQKQIDNITAEENFKETKKAIKKFLRFKGKIIVWQVADWKSYMFKCKDIVPRKSKYKTPELEFFADGDIYRYDGTANKENLEVLEGTESILIGVESKTLNQFQEMKNWNFWEKRPVIKLIIAAKGVEALIKESGMDTTIDYDDKPVKQTK